MSEEVKYIKPGQAKYTQSCKKEGINRIMWFISTLINNSNRPNLPKKLFTLDFWVKWFYFTSFLISFLKKYAYVISNSKKCHTNSICLVRPKFAVHYIICSVHTHSSKERRVVHKTWRSFERLKKLYLFFGNVGYNWLYGSIR